MNERTQQNITIYRYGDGGTRQAVCSVPITSTSQRKFTLMSEDFVRLDFDLEDAVSFKIGDFIEDELFGYFQITSKQMPQYVEATGAYHYELKFDAEYYAWGNRLFMLTTTATAQGDRTRKEATWYLTAQLATHLDEVINNLAVLGYNYTYTIDSSADHATEVKLMSYGGVSILAALNNLASTFETEWWVDRSANVIHFGKCQKSADSILLRQGYNVSSLSIQENRNTYANRIYVFGSSNNIPGTYRKTLLVKVTSKASKNGWTLYYTDKELTADMFPGVGNVEFKLKGKFTCQLNTAGNVFTFTDASDLVEITKAGRYKLYVPEITIPGVRVNGENEFAGYSYSVKVEIINSSGSAMWSQSQNTGGQVSGTSFMTPSVTFSASSSAYADITEGVYSLRCVITISASHVIQSTSLPTESSDVIIEARSNAAGDGVISLKHAGVTDSALINPLGVEKYNASGVKQTDFFAFGFINSSGSASTPSVAVNVGDTLTVDTSNSYLVPTAFFSTIYDDPSALARIGENRLQMPQYDDDGAPILGYLQQPGVTDRDAVEMAVAFDNIYPDGKLIISSITTAEKRDVTKYEGEIETSDWQWLEYTLSVRLASGATFNFKNEMRLDNTPLQIRFLTPQDMGWTSADYNADNCKLAGMTFDVSFNRAKGTFTIVRNNDFGTMLPGSALVPHVGDPVVLIGWNVNAMSSLGLISDAENRLLAKAQQYLAAMEESAFTFDAVMTSEWSFVQASKQRLRDADSLAVKTADGVNVYVKGGDVVTSSAYTLMTEGQPVTIQHDALNADKASRVIGYELKLDKPYDAPRYTIGETEAYSNLARLEKEITKISNN